jgi:hypothetical protein
MLDNVEGRKKKEERRKNGINTEFTEAGAQRSWSRIVTSRKVFVKLRLPGVGAIAGRRWRA